MAHLLPSQPIATLDDVEQRGGPVLAVCSDLGLYKRGGAGSSTGTNWHGVATADGRGA